MRRLAPRTRVLSLLPQDSDDLALPRANACTPSRGVRTHCAVRPRGGNARVVRGQRRPLPAARRSAAERPTRSSCSRARASSARSRRCDLYKEGCGPNRRAQPGPSGTGRASCSASAASGSRTEVELERDALAQLGIPPAAIIATNGYVDNTAQEANLLRAMVQGPRLAPGDHRAPRSTTPAAPRSRSRRGLEGTGAQVVMRASRYDSSDPARWWRSRADLRFAAERMAEADRVPARAWADNRNSEANGARWPSRSSKSVASRVEREG